ncbi:jg20224 [Pararge aegeria aegeria]|uniref:Jg20224 protein n=1 Tax=Pararge aegeria aegeria TaxID=348720 RepID=A0A8S4R542_9NEOP|nr:jg20224 [Pararge aegeria aegeria]
MPYSGPVSDITCSHIGCGALPEAGRNSALAAIARVPSRRRTRNDMRAAATAAHARHLRTETLRQHHIY